MTGTASDPIVVNALSKTYQVTDREGGFKAAVGSFFKRKFRDVKAVQQVSFRIGAGEIVGFLGPNGAGKTTTLKMLSGSDVPGLAAQHHHFCHPHSGRDDCTAAGIARRIGGVAGRGVSTGRCGCRLHLIACLESRRQALQRRFVIVAG